jgi:ribosomal protein S18 acetylase RimI-like enzyme
VPFTIRPAAVEDADAIGAVHVRAWQAAYRGVMPDEYLDGPRAQDRADGWRRHLTALRPDQKVLVVIDRDRVVGFAIFGCERGSDASQDVGELYAINLDPDVWDRGIGRALLRRATDELAEAGYAEAVLWVVPQNQRARDLYESEGWIDNTSNVTTRSSASRCLRCCIGGSSSSRTVRHLRYPSSASGYPDSPSPLPPAVGRTAQRSPRGRWGRLGRWMIATSR